MKTQPYLIRYIIVYLVPLAEWIKLPYQSKKAYHYVVAGNKVKALRRLQAQSGCIEVAHVGSQPTDRSKSLFSLLLDLSISHPEAKIVYASELVNPSTDTPIVLASHWLKQYMPNWFRKRLFNFSNLLTLLTFFP